MDSAGPKMNVFSRSQSRQHNRFTTWNYSDEAWYFVTICTGDHSEIFGAVRDDEMILNEFGKVVWECWKDLPNHYPRCFLDEFIVMPNHVHGIIVIENQVGTGFKPVPTNNKKYS